MYGLLLCSLIIQPPLKIELCVGSSVLRFFHISHIVRNGRNVLIIYVIFTNSFHIKTENEEFTAEGPCCRQNLKFEDFALSFGRYVKELHQSACCTCSKFNCPPSANHRKKKKEKTTTTTKNKFEKSRCAVECHHLVT